MHFTNIIFPIIAALSATTTAAPAASSSSKPYTWSVSDFSLGCSPGGCTTLGKITAPKHRKMPSFSASCSSTSYEKKYVKCKDNANVSHYWQFVNEDGAQKVLVHYKYEANGKTYEASKTIALPPYQQTVDFTLTSKKN